MIGFIKKRIENILNDKTQEDTSGEDKIISGYMATDAARAASEKATSKFVKPETYTGNRSLYDSAKAKSQAKKELFKGGKKVFDPFTGKELVQTVEEAKARFGSDWQNHLAESDHVMPLERMHKKGKDNPWLTNDDIRDISNNPDNIQVVSRKFNNAKRSRTTKEFIEDESFLESKGIKLTKEGKKAAVHYENMAETSISRNLQKRTVKNFVSTAHEAGKCGAQNAGVAAVTYSTLMNIGAVLKGEKDADEAIRDIAIDGGKAAVTGYAMSSGLATVSHSLSGSSSKFIQALTKSNIPGQVITAVMVTGDTLKRYGNGEITTQECLLELGEKGLNLATASYSMALGQALIPIPIVGATVGALVGTLATSCYYNDLINILKTRELEHQERLRIIAECNMAVAKEKEYRKELERYLASYFKGYQDCFDEALSDIKFAFQSGNADGIISGANKITRKLGGNVYYDTVDEFVDFINDDTVDVF